MNVSDLVLIFGNKKNMSVDTGIPQPIISSWGDGPVPTHFKPDIQEAAELRKPEIDKAFKRVMK